MQCKTAQTNFRSQVAKVLLLILVQGFYLFPSRSSLLWAQTPQHDQPEQSSIQAAGIDEPRNGDDTEITGGREAAPGAWLWQAALVRANVENAYDGQFCGGSLIAPGWVLTAAHCINYENPQNIDVVLGRRQLSSNEGVRIHSAELIIHPNYGSRSFDVGLIRLAITSTLPTIDLYQALPDEDETKFVGAIVTGWGMTEEYSSSDILREVDVPIISHAVCNAPEAYSGLITETMLCAGFQKGYKDSCYGDSGGPLMVNNPLDGRWLQVGIVSWGDGCGNPNKYGVYARVSKLAEWIQGCLTNTASGPCIGGDNYEPDNSPEEAVLLPTTGETQIHYFHSSQDRDWLRFDALANVTYLIVTQSIGVSSDTLLWLYSENGMAPIIYNEDSGAERAASLVWRAPRTGVYYLQVQDQAGSHGQDSAYSIQINALPNQLYFPVIAF